MTDYNNTDFHISFKQYECNSIKTIDFTNTLFFESKLKPKDVTCPVCGGKVKTNKVYTLTLKDMPIFAENKQIIRIKLHRFVCKECRKTFKEEELLSYENSRITTRAAKWIKTLLLFGFTILSINKITGISWHTIKKIHSEIMNKTLKDYWQEKYNSSYKPKRIAVDEFAIQKGHKYATVVLDIDTGEIIWVGKGKTYACFEKFFREIEISYLSEIKAVAMDMNASFNKVVNKYLPNARIVYDRYHITASFTRDVLSYVRLKEAKEHKKKALEIKKLIKSEKDKNKKKDYKLQEEKEREQYKSLKNARWAVAKNKNKLTLQKQEDLEVILNSHNELSLCYAMKEEMHRLFELSNQDEARLGWFNWINAAKVSGIKPLVKFAKAMAKRLEGLVSHAVYFISTAKLEGFNNKIKVAKRIAYGYRDYNYFFTLIKYLSISKIRI